jgi:diacylglycerol kinase (ATP)
MLNNRKFLVFINPISGAKNKVAAQKIVEEQLTKNKFAYEILPTQKDANYNYLNEKIEQDKITDVIICGGDGSVNQIGAYLTKSKVNIGIIPLGSGNGLAFTAGISANASKAMDIIIKGKLQKIDAFYINQHFSCHLIGVGFDAEVAHQFAVHPSRGGAIYVKLVIKNYFKAKPYPFQIKIADKIINTQAFFVCVANSNQFGNKIKIAPKASLSDGLLDVVVVNKTNKLDVFFKMMRQLFLGQVKNVDDKRRVVQYYQTKDIEIINNAKAPLHIDGEPFDTEKNIKIKIIENALNLLVP